MSLAAPPAVLRALEPAPDGPVLVYDLGIVARRMELAREAARAAGVSLLYAVKAFPLRDAIALAVQHLDGLDVAGPEEQALAATLPPTTVSVTWPGDVAAARIGALLAAGHRVTVICETAAQVADAASLRGVTVGVRLLADDDSRFGIAPADLPSLPARDRIRALHLHGGPLATSPTLIAERARRALAAATAANLPLEQLDLGGSLHGFAVDRPASGQSQLAAAFAAARAAVPPHIHLLFEPGRLWTETAGFAAGRVLAARDHGARLLRVLSLSRLAHLRWCTPRLAAPPPRAGEPRHHVALLGSSCCEDDHIGDALVPTSFLPHLAVGELAILGGVTGYAAAWNRGFAGVPPATVVGTGS